jgi:uncharacterized membrane protein YdjX (TVP38/TMEM64 family)
MPVSRDTTKKILLSLILLTMAGLAIWFAQTTSAAQLASLLGEFKANYPLLTVLLFILIYTFAAVIFFPGLILTLAAGAVFGPVAGALYSVSGATMGAGLAFLIARYLAGDWAKRRSGPRLQQLRDGIEQDGWKFVAFVRLVPVFPFNLLNYALGLTTIPFPQYFFSSWLFMLPGAFAYAWLGYAGQAAISGDEQTIRNIMIAIGLIAVVAYLPRLMRFFRHRHD